VVLVPSVHGTVSAVPRIRVPARWSSVLLRAKIDEVGDEVVGAEDRRRQSYARHD
jgi:hypothetical protein